MFQGELQYGVLCSRECILPWNSIFHGGCSSFENTFTWRSLFQGVHSSMEGVLPSRTLLHEDHCVREFTLPWRAFLLRKHFYMKWRALFQGVHSFHGERFSFENTFTWSTLFHEKCSLFFHGLESSMKRSVSWSARYQGGHFLLELRFRGSAVPDSAMFLKMLCLGTSLFQRVHCFSECTVLGELIFHEENYSGEWMHYIPRKQGGVLMSVLFFCR